MLRIDRHWRVRRIEFSAVVDAAGGVDEAIAACVRATGRAVGADCRLDGDRMRWRLALRDVDADLLTEALTLVAEEVGDQAVDGVGAAGRGAG